LSCFGRTVCDQPITQEQRWLRPIAALEGQALRFETAIDNIPQGVCFFDGDQKLIPCNRRNAEIYRIAPSFCILD